MSDSATLPGALVQRDRCENGWQGCGTQHTRSALQQNRGDSKDTSSPPSDAVGADRSIADEGSKHPKRTPPLSMAMRPYGEPADAGCEGRRRPLRRLPRAMGSALVAVGRTVEVNDGLLNSMRAACERICDGRDAGLAAAQTSAFGVREGPAPLGFPGMLGGMLKGAEEECGGGESPLLWELASEAEKLLAGLAAAVEAGPAAAECCAPRAGRLGGAEGGALGEQLDALGRAVAANDVLLARILFESPSAEGGARRARQRDTDPREAAAAAAAAAAEEEEEAAVEGLIQQLWARVLSSVPPQMRGRFFSVWSPGRILSPQMRESERIRAAELPGLSLAGTRPPSPPFPSHPLPRQRAAVEELEGDHCHQMPSLSPLRSISSRT